MRHAAALITLAAASVAFVPSLALSNDVDYEAPTGYYDSASNLTGTALKAQLTTIMTTGFVARSYGDARYAFAITDADPNNAGKILLIYNRASVNSAWDGGATYNREHQWPCSLLGMDTPSNSYKGVASDLHMLRPSNPSINSARSNEPFGGATNTGGYQDYGSYWFPGSADSGDIARSMFYAATRWNSFNNLTLINGTSTPTYKMGDLNALLHWNYTDTPDEFERHRNQAVYSAGLNPSYYQGNRNAYVDHPEYVWSVFVDQENDTSLSTSTSTVDLGKVIVGSSFGTQNVTINKAGVDGTYYSVNAAGSATSTVGGRLNAFAMDATGSKTTTIGLSGSTATAGLKSGTVTIDNLDVTTQGGAGKGANDANDVVNVTGKVVSHAKASLASNTTTTSINLDFGTLQQNSGTGIQSFSLFDLVTGSADYTAGLDLDSILFTGDSAFSSNLALLSNLAAGSGHGFNIFLDTTSLGSFAGTYMLTTSDENIAGAATFAPLTVNVSGIVAVPEPATFGLLGLLVPMALRRRRQVA